MIIPRTQLLIQLQYNIKHKMQGKKMTKAEQLINILNKEIIPEIDNIIDDMCELIADNKNATDEDKAEFKEAQAKKKEFKEMAFEAEQVRWMKKSVLKTCLNVKRF